MEKDYIVPAGHTAVKSEASHIKEAFGTNMAGDTRIQI